MMISDELIERFLKRQCTPKEITEVWQYFQENPTEMDRLLDKEEWDDTIMKGGEGDGKQDEALSAAMLNEIRRHAYEVPQEKRTLPLWRWAAAAVIILIIGAGTWLVTQPRKMNEQIIVQKSRDEKAAKKEWVVRTNISDKEMSINLPDGSTVLLAANSTLRYDQEGRETSLNGAAFFDVAKHTGQPFKVYSGKLTTTVLGTSFRVNTKESLISVLLLTGKVVVNAGKKDIVLRPGELLQYDTGNGRMAVQRIRHPERAETVAHNSPNPWIREEHGALIFDNVPFHEVMSRLEKKYGVRIQYDRSTTSDIYFSGTVSTTDSLTIVLKVIARMNGLEVQEQQGTYVVRKPRQ